MLGPTFIILSRAPQKSGTALARETDECRSETKLHQDLTPPLLHLLFPINKCVRERGAAIKRPTKTKTKEPNQHTQHNTTQASPPHPTTTPSFDLHPRSPNLSSLRPLSAPLDPPMRIRRRPPGQPLPYSSSVTNDSAADLGDGRSSSSSSALIRRPALSPQVRVLAAAAAAASFFFSSFSIDSNPRTHP